MIDFMIKWLAWMKLGTIPQQLMAFISLSALGTAILAFINNDIMPDLFFAKFWIGLIITDTLLGAMRHLKQRNFSTKAMFLGLLTKAGISLAGMYILKTIPSALTEVEFLTDYFTLFIKIAVLTYLAGSAIGNVYILSGGKFPPEAFMNKWDKFEKTNNLQELISEAKDNGEVH